MKRVFNLLVVDESGSMEIIRKQALMGINETLETIRKIEKAHQDLEQRVTLITFDSTHKKLFYDNVAAADARSLDAIIVRVEQRRSMTPLVWASRRLTPRQRMTTMSL